MARIKVLGYKEATGKLKYIYDDLIKKRGKLANVLTIQSLRPESIINHADLYMEIMFTKSELSRAEREMIAVVVSAGNNCSYCQIHHAEALNHYWKNDEKTAMLKENYKKVDLNERQVSLCDYAMKLTTEPGTSADVDQTIPLKNIGLSDSAILDATLIVSYFNFVNRMVLGLGVHLESDAGTGYKY
jgi:uncharacterized peroxidase-related enzyme